MRSSGHEKGDLGKDKSPSVREELVATVILVFQQVDDLTDHDQNGTQSHRLTPPISNKRIATRLPLRAAAPDCTVVPRSRTGHTPSRAAPAPRPRTRP